uniref:Uncharacterized protein n=1 Tax=Opuntia streptacantha TaxID=393608 RepID=A0A7C9E4N2_OPUST
MNQGCAKHLDLDPWTIHLPKLVHFWAHNNHIILHPWWSRVVPKRGPAGVVSMFLLLWLEYKVILRYQILGLSLSNACQELDQSQPVLVLFYPGALTSQSSPIPMYLRLYLFRQ